MLDIEHKSEYVVSWNRILNDRIACVIREFIDEQES